MADPLLQLSQLVLSPSEPPEPGFAARLRSDIEAVEAASLRGGGQGWHLAQLNLGVFKLPLDAPEMAPFVAALDRINAIADESPGFVWRLKGDDGEPSSFVDVPGATDPMLASNLSVWVDLESLRQFMYRTDHASYLRRRSQWFVHSKETMGVAWWIPAGTVPSLPEALRRLEHLRTYGPSDEGFPLGRNIPGPPD